MTKEKIEVAGDDFREGLTAVISVKVMEPQFEGQTKTKLGNSEVAGAVDRIVGEMLTNYLEEHPNEARIIVSKVVLAAKARIAARKAREMVQRKTVLGSHSLPESWPTVLRPTPHSARSFWLKETLRAVPPSKVAIAVFRLFCPCAARF